MKNGIDLERLPLWKGIEARPGVKEAFPFRLGLHPLGFINQTTEDAVRQKVVDAYAQDEYGYMTQPPGRSRWASNLGERRIAFVKAVAGSLDGKHCLEIGAGTSYIAKRLCGEYAIAEYMIVDPTMAKDLEEAPPIRVQRAYFDKSVALPDERYDWILTFSCLEHILDAVTFLADMRQKLNPRGGRAVLVLPDAEAALRAGNYNVLLHEHLNYFTRTTFEAVVRDLGYNLLHCDSRHDTLSVVLGVADPDPSALDSARVASETLLAEADAAFRRGLEAFKATTAARLARGGRIAFHGATNGLNSLLYLCGFETADGIRVFDGDESKAGRYLPACREPIRHTSDPSYRECEEIWISAVSFFEEIKRDILSKHPIEESRIRSILTPA